MTQLFTTGRVVTDLELKSSAKQNLYIHFTLVERIGYSQHALPRKQSFICILKRTISISGCI